MRASKESLSKGGFPALAVHVTASAAQRESQDPPLPALSHGKFHSLSAHVAGTDTACSP